MALTISQAKIKNILDKAAAIDTSNLEESEIRKVNDCIALLSDKKLNFDYLASKAGCPYFYDPSSAKLCDLSENEANPCDKCWFMNLSEHMGEDDKKEDVSASMEDDVSSYRKLYEYEATGMTPEMISRVLTYLKWDKGQSFEKFYAALTGEEEKNEQELEI